MPQFQESEVQRGFGNSPKKPLSEWTDLVSEITEITELAKKHRVKGGRADPNIIWDQQIMNRRAKLIEELKNSPSGLCEVLGKTIMFGIAYHHSGLTNDEKLIVEKGYR